ncbi:unnamed protein product [Lampetra fluviatilis]
MRVSAANSCGKERARCRRRWGPVELRCAGRDREFGDQRDNSKQGRPWGAGSAGSSSGQQQPTPLSTPATHTQSGKRDAQKPAQRTANVRTCVMTLEEQNITSRLKVQLQAIWNLGIAALNHACEPPFFFSPPPNSPPSHPNGTADAHDDDDDGDDDDDDDASRCHQTPRPVRSLAGAGGSADFLRIGARELGRGKVDFGFFSAELHNAFETNSTVRLVKTAVGRPAARPAHSAILSFVSVS